MISEFRKHILFRTIALGICLVFGWSSMGQADVVESVFKAVQGPATDLTSLNFPPTLGEVISFHKGTQDYTVVHIVDAHCDYSVQHSIADIIGYCNDNYGIDTVALEGGSGDYDVSVFTGIKNRKVRESTADYFVKQGEVNGAEFYAINNPAKVSLYGIEDPGLYVKNLNAYRDSLKYQGDINNILSALTTVISKLKTKIYPRDFKEFDKKAGLFREDKISLEEYVLAMSDVVKKEKIGLSEYPNMARYRDAIGYKKDIDSKNIIKDCNALLGLLKTHLPKKYLDEMDIKTAAFSRGEIEPEVYYAYLLDKAGLCGVRPDKTGNLMKFIDFTRKTKSINKKVLEKELKALEGRISSSFLKTDEQKKLYLADKKVLILERMFLAGITRDDWEYYYANRGGFDVSGFYPFLSEESSAHNIALGAYETLAPLDIYRKDMEKFYDISISRDKVFLDKVISKLKKEKKDRIIIVTGGFHQDNLRKLFADKGYSYVEVLPKIEKQDTKCPYFKLISGGADPVTKAIIDRQSSLQVATYLDGQLSRMVHDVDAFRQAVGTVQNLTSSGVDVVTDSAEEKRLADTPADNRKEFNAILHLIVWQLILQVLTDCTPLILGNAVLAALIVFMHELAHKKTLNWFGVKNVRIQLRMVKKFSPGAVTVYDSDELVKLPSWKLKRAIVALAGPAMNFILAGLFYLLETFAGGYPVIGPIIHFGVLGNLVMGTFGSAMDFLRLFRLDNDLRKARTNEMYELHKVTPSAPQQQVVAIAESDKELLAYLKRIGIDVRTKAHPSIKDRVVIYEMSKWGFNIIYTSELPNGLLSCSVYEKDWKSDNPQKPKDMFLRAGLEDGEEAILISVSMNPGRLKFIRSHELGYAVEGRNEFSNRLADLVIPINMEATLKEKMQAVFSLQYLVSVSITVVTTVFLFLFMSMVYISIIAGLFLTDIVLFPIPPLILMIVSRLFYNSWFFIAEGKFKPKPIIEIPDAMNLSVDYKQYRILSEEGYFSTVYVALDGSNVIKLQSDKEIGRLNKERAKVLKPNERQSQASIAEDINRGPVQLAARCRWTDLSDEKPRDAKGMKIDRALTKNGALVMEPVISLKTQIQYVVRRGNIEGAKSLLKDFIRNQRNIWAQGYFDVDATVSNYGATVDGIMVTHDLDYVFKIDTPTEDMYDFFLSRFVRENIKILEEIGGEGLGMAFRQLLTEAGIATALVGTEERWGEFMRVPVETDSHIVIPAKEAMRASAIKELSTLVAQAKEVSVQPALHEKPVGEAARDYGLPRDTKPLPELLRTEEVMAKVVESIKGIKFSAERDSETDRFNYYNALRVVLDELAKTGWDYEEARKIAILIIEGLPGKMGYVSVPDVSDFGEVNSYSYWLFSGLFVELIKFAVEVDLNKNDLYQIIEESFHMNGFDAFVYRKIFEMRGKDYISQRQKDAVKGIIGNVVTSKDMGSFEAREAAIRMFGYANESDFAWRLGADVIHERVAMRDKKEAALGMFTPEMFDGLKKETGDAFYVRAKGSALDLIDVGDHRVYDFIVKNRIGIVPKNSRGILTLWTTSEVLEAAKEFTDHNGRHRIAISRDGRIYFVKEVNTEEEARREIENTRKGGLSNLVILDGTGTYVVTEFLTDHCEMAFTYARVGEDVWGIISSEVYKQKSKADEMLEVLGITEDFADANYMAQVSVDRMHDKRKGGLVVKLERIDYEPYVKGRPEVKSRPEAAPAVPMPVGTIDSRRPSFGHTENLARYIGILNDAMNGKDYAHAFGVIMEALESVPNEDEIDLSVVNFDPFKNNLSDFVAAVYANKAGPGYEEFTFLLGSSDITGLKERLARILPLLRSNQKEIILFIAGSTRSTTGTYMDWLTKEVLFDVDRIGMIKTMDESDMEAVKAISRRISTRGIRDVELTAAAGKSMDDMSNNIYVYKDAGKVLGYVYFSYLEKGKSLSINQIAISEESEGEGIASLLLGKALSQAIAQGIISFECEIKATAERSFNMFERFAFKRGKANVSGFAVRYTLNLTAEAPVSVENSYVDSKKHLEGSLQKIKDILASIFRNLFNGEPIRIYVLGATPTGEDGTQYSELEYSSDLVSERVQAGRMVNERSGIGTGNVEINHTIGVESARKKIADDIANLPSDMPKERAYCAISAFVLSRLEEDKILTEKLGKSVKTFLEERTMLNIIDDFRDNRVYLMPYLEATVLGLTRINLVSELKKTNDINSEGVRGAIDVFVRAMALVSNMPDNDIKEALRELMTAAKDGPMNFFRNYTFRITLPPITKIRLEELRDHIHSMIEVWRSL